MSSALTDGPSSVGVLEVYLGRFVSNYGKNILPAPALAVGSRVVGQSPLRDPTSIESAEP